MTDEKAIEKMLYDQQQGWPLCPRCGERMPDKLTHGALSRHANGVYICEACGTDEALRDWTGNVKRSLHRLLCHGDAQRRFE